LGFDAKHTPKSLPLLQQEHKHNPMGTKKKNRELVLLTIQNIISSLFLRRFDPEKNPFKNQVAVAEEPASQTQVRIKHA
jgi:hypothetical protein